MDNKKLTLKFLEKVKPDVSGANFKAFFSYSLIESLGEDKIILSTPTAFAKETLIQRHLPLIENAFKDILGSEFKIEIIVKSRFQNQSEEEEDLFMPIERKGDNYLNSKYTLENFVVGPSNNLAFAGAQAVVANPGLSYNPLFLYGGTGVGKTHLMVATGNALVKKKPNLKIIYCSSEKFMNDYVSAIQEHKMADLRKRYRSADLLLIDDIQFFSGREGTQEEFFHTFNELQGKNAQMVITSDRAPSDIEKIEDRLKSRFAGGLMVDIQPPDYDTRVAILKAKCLEKGENIPEEVLKLLASSLDSNIRELEGRLIHLLQTLKLNNLPATLENVSSLIAQPNKRMSPADPRQVLDTICTYFNLNLKDLTGPRRQKELVLPRHISMYLLSEELSLTVQKIGHLLGKRDHTTVMHGRDRIKKLAVSDREVQRILIEIKQKIN